jgi:hypothetical protein
MPVLLKQYEILQSEKRMLQQIENATVAFLVTGGVAALVAYAQTQAAIAREIVDLNSTGAAAAAAEAAFASARSAANLLIVLVPPALLGGASFLVSMHARVRRVATFCSYLERVINVVAGTSRRIIGWETLSIVLRRGRGWTFWLLAMGVGLALVVWLLFAQPIVDRGDTRFDPAVYVLVNVLLVGLILASWISHRLDQRYYGRAFPVHFGPDWQKAQDPRPDEPPGSAPQAGL